VQISTKSIEVTIDEQSALINLYLLWC